MSLAVLFGWAVRTGPTPLDDWFQQAHGSVLRHLLFFTDYRTIGVLLEAAVAVALYRRRWLLAWLTVVTPLVAVLIERACKQVVGRWKGEALSYPSGHTTVMVVALGMLALAAGARLWVVASCVVFAVLGMLGQAVSYHYFTDTVGALLLGTSLVCITAAIVDRCQPRCGTGHTPWLRWPP